MSATPPPPVTEAPPPPATDLLDDLDFHSAPYINRRHWLQREFFRMTHKNALLICEERELATKKMHPTNPVNASVEDVLEVKTHIESHIGRIGRIGRAATRATRARGRGGPGGRRAGQRGRGVLV